MEEPVAVQQSEQSKKRVWVTPVVEIIDRADVETGHYTTHREAYIIKKYPTYHSFPSFGVS